MNRLRSLREGDRSLRANAVAVAVSCCALWGAVVYLLMPMQVTVDGTARLVANGATVRDVVSLGLTTARHGNVLGIRGGVVARGKGGLPLVTVDGRPAALDDQVLPGAVLSSTRGPDVREAIVAALTAVPPPVQTIGTGPQALPDTLGAPGLALATMGSVSHAIVTSRPIRPPVPMVMQLSQFPAGTKLIALTFDDGPWPGQTQRVLDTLRAQGVRATFFMVGIRIRRAPGLARRVVAEGNTVGNHTLSHHALQHSTKRDAINQMVVGARAIRRFTGVRTKWFRAPGGNLTPVVVAEARKLGEGIVGWNVDTRDWSKPPVRRIVSRAVNHARPGAVILMHDGGGDRSRSIKALPAIIERLRAKGYRFVTLDEMAAAGLQPPR